MKIKEILNLIKKKSPQANKAHFVTIRIPIPEAWVPDPKGKQITVDVPPFGALPVHGGSREFFIVSLTVTMLEAAIAQDQGDAEISSPDLQAEAAQAS